MNSLGKQVLAAAGIFVLSLLIGYFGMKLIRSNIVNKNPEPNPKPIINTAGGGGSVASSQERPKITQQPETKSTGDLRIVSAECKFMGEQYGYRIYPTMVNADGADLSFRLVSADGRSTDYPGEKDGSNWFIRLVPASKSPYSLIAVDKRTGKESSPFEVDGCKPQFKPLTATELTSALNSRDISAVQKKVRQPLSITVVGDTVKVSQLSNIVVNLNTGIWNHVEVSDVRCDDSGLVVSFTLTVQKN